jgi:hypothetical protein
VPDCEAPITLYRFPTDSFAIGYDGQPFGAESYPGWHVLHGHQSLDSITGHCFLMTWLSVAETLPSWQRTLSNIHYEAERYPRLRAAYLQRIANARAQ